MACTMDRAYRLLMEFVKRDYTEFTYLREAEASWYVCGIAYAQDDTLTDLSRSM